MAKDKIIGQIYETSDYSKFKRLEGNRKVITARVKKIIDSIKQVGYVKAPIIVNEQYQIIDGQGRFEALKKLGLPVYYIVVEGIGVDECIAMNINQTNWGIIDYIESYAEMGNVSYMYLLNLIKAYGQAFQNKVIFCIATGTFDGTSTKLKKGSLVFKAEDYNQAQATLSWLTNFIPIIDRINGHTEYYYNALAFCYGDDEIDNERLLVKMGQMQANLIPVTTMQQAFEVIESIYNNRSRKHIYIKTNYLKALDDKYSWYRNKYGNRYED